MFSIALLSQKKKKTLTQQLSINIKFTIHIWDPGPQNTTQVAGVYL